MWGNSELIDRVASVLYHLTPKIPNPDEPWLYTAWLKLTDEERKPYLTRAEEFVVVDAILHPRPQ